MKEDEKGMDYQPKFYHATSWSNDSTEAQGVQRELPDNAACFTREWSNTFFTLTSVLKADRCPSTLLAV